jgi:hypothetical protein
MPVSYGSFKEISTERERKLKYEGYCEKCGKVRFHRLDGGSLYTTRFRCMKCKNLTEENQRWVK